MEATKPIASSSKSTGDEGASAAAASKTTDNNANDKTQSSQSDEDFLMFGARPSHLFDDAAVTLDPLMCAVVRVNLQPLQLVMNR